MKDLFPPPPDKNRSNWFFKDEFNPAFTESDLIKFLKSKGVPISSEGNAIGKLNKLVEMRGLYKICFNKLPLPVWSPVLIKNEARIDKNLRRQLNRSLLFTAFPQKVPQEVSLNNQIESFETLRLLFIFFQAGTLELKDLELTKDIRDAIKLISNIEDFERGRKANSKKKHKYELFPRKPIKDLSYLLEKGLIRIGVNFEIDNLISRNREKEKSFKDFIIKTKGNFEKMGADKNPSLKFHLKGRHSSFQREENIREILTYGLFYYADQLMGRKFPRPRRCSCNNWYFAIKNTQKYCTVICKERHYIGDTDGMIKNKNAAWLCRQRKGQGLIPERIFFREFNKIPSLQDSELDPNNREGIWDRKSISVARNRPNISGLRLKRDIIQQKEYFHTIIPTKDFKKLWPLLIRANKVRKSFLMLSQ